MAKIGAFGSMVFSVSENTVKTFDQISWDKSIKYTNVRIFILFIIKNGFFFDSVIPFRIYVITFLLLRWEWFAGF